MAAVALSTTPALARISSSTTSRRFSGGRTYLSFTSTLTTTSSTTSPRNTLLLRAAANSDNDDSANLSQEDLSYVVKLGAGSVVGAAAIKYGSAIFPEITRPNIIEALVIIFFPVIVAVLLLLRQSLSK